MPELEAKNIRSARKIDDDCTGCIYFKIQTTGGENLEISADDVSAMELETRNRIEQLASMNA